MAGCVWIWVVTLCVFILILHFSTAQTNQTQCVRGRYGHNCTETCGSCADPNDCDNVTGACPSCKTGFNGTLCKECSDDHYNVSNDCRNTCGEGCHDTCSRTDGTCQCRQGWQLPLCQQCSPSYWGSKCSPCGTGCMDTCDPSNGTCRCKDGWTGSRCTECAQGRYGLNCIEICGHCADLNDCDNVTGACPSCKIGFNGTLCKDCAVGYWGDTCSHLCGPGCQNGACDVVHGTCDCKRGWEMPICEDCTAGHYNVSNDCHNTCGGGCHDTCSRTDGTCQCQQGWQPPLCQWCGDGWFGSECTECGHCANNSVCDKKTGVCPFCDGDFVAPLCLHAVSPCKDSCGVAGPVAGAAICCSIVFFIVGAIFGWWLRKSRSNQPSQADYSHEEFSTKSNLGTPALSLRRLAERPARPESPKDRPEDTSDYGNIGFDSYVYEESVVSDNKKTAYTPLHFPVNSEKTDTTNINASVRSKTAGPGKQTKF